MFNLYLILFMQYDKYLLLMLILDLVLILCYRVKGVFLMLMSRIILGRVS